MLTLRSGTSVESALQAPTAGSSTGGYTVTRYADSPREAHTSSTQTVSNDLTSSRLHDGPLATMALAMRELQIGGWQVYPEEGRLLHGGREVNLEPRVMQLLTYLAERPGKVISRDQILDDVWQGAFVGDNALHTAIAALRRALGDDARQPRYIETIARRGYRLRATVSRRRSLAVLPLRDLSPRPDEEFLAEGLTDALIGELGRTGAVDVVSRHSAMAVGRTETPLSEVAARLDVEWIVEGTMQRRDENVRVDVDLVDASSDRQIWSKDFERDFRELSALQGDLTAAVCSEIVARSSSATPPAKAIHPDALLHLMRGQFHFYKLSPRHFDRAVEHFRAALDIDPTLGDAHAGLADLHGASAYWGLRPAAEAEPSLRRAVEDALRVEPDSAYAHAMQGAIHFYLEREYAASEESLRRALDHNPSAFPANLLLTLLHIAVGKLDRALSWALRAQQLDPLNPAAAVAEASTHLARGNEAAALEELHGALELEPQHDATHQLLADSYWRRGEDDRALRHEAMWWQPRLEPEQNPFVAAAARSARQALSSFATQLEQRARDHYVQPTELARLFALLHDEENALRWLKRALDLGDMRLVDVIRLEPRWRSLRGHHRFRELLEALDLEPSPIRQS